MADEDLFNPFAALQDPNFRQLPLLERFQQFHQTLSQYPEYLQMTPQERDYVRSQLLGVESPDLYKGILSDDRVKNSSYEKKTRLFHALVSDDQNWQELNPEERQFVRAQALGEPTEEDERRPLQLQEIPTFQHRPMVPTQERFIAPPNAQDIPEDLRLPEARRQAAEQEQIMRDFAYNQMAMGTPAAGEVADVYRAMKIPGIGEAVAGAVSNIGNIPSTYSELAANITEGAANLLRHDPILAGDQYRKEQGVPMDLTQLGQGQQPQPPRNAGEWLHQKVAQPLHEFSQEYAQALDLSIPKAKVGRIEDIKNIGDFGNYFMRTTGDMAGFMAQVMAGQAAGGGIGAYIATLAPSVADVSQELTANGEPMRPGLALPAGMAIAFLEKLGFDKLHKVVSGETRNQIEKFLVSKLVGGFETGGVEGLTEVLQEIVSIETLKIKNKEPLFDWLKDFSQEEWSRLANAGAAGFLGTVGLGSVGGAAAEGDRSVQDLQNFFKILSKDFDEEVRSYEQQAEDEVNAQFEAEGAQLRDQRAEAERRRQIEEEALDRRRYEEQAAQEALLPQPERGVAGALEVGDRFRVAPKEGEQDLGVVTVTGTEKVGGHSVDISYQDDYGNEGTMRLGKPKPVEIHPPQKPFTEAPAQIETEDDLRQALTHGFANVSEVQREGLVSLVSAFAATRGMTPSEYISKRFGAILREQQTPSAPGEIQQRGPAHSTKASIRFTEDGQAVINAFQTADVSSAVHSLGQVFLQDLRSDEMAILNDWLGVREGQEWTEKEKNKFSRGLERYLYDGSSPNKTMKPIFQRFKAWMQAVYEGLKGSPISRARPSDAARAVFDQMFSLQESQVADFKAREQDVIKRTREQRKAEREAARKAEREIRTDAILNAALRKGGTSVQAVVKELARQGIKASQYDVSRVLNQAVKEGRLEKYNVRGKKGSYYRQATKETAAPVEAAPTPAAFRKEITDALAAAETVDQLKDINSRINQWSKQRLDKPAEPGGRDTAVDLLKASEERKAELEEALKPQRVRASQIEIGDEINVPDVGRVVVSEVLKGKKGERFISYNTLEGEVGDVYRAHPNTKVERFEAPTAEAREAQKARRAQLMEELIKKGKEEEARAEQPVEQQPVEEKPPEAQPKEEAAPKEEKAPEEEPVHMSRNADKIAAKMREIAERDGIDTGVVNDYIAAIEEGNHPHDIYDDERFKSVRGEIIDYATLLDSAVHERNIHEKTQRAMEREAAPTEEEMAAERAQAEETTPETETTTEPSPETEEEVAEEVRKEEKAGVFRTSPVQRAEKQRHESMKRGSKWQRRKLDRITRPGHMSRAQFDAWIQKGRLVQKHILEGRAEATRIRAIIKNLVKQGKERGDVVKMILDVQDGKKTMLEFAQDLGVTTSHPAVKILGEIMERNRTRQEFFKKSPHLPETVRRDMLDVDFYQTLAYMRFLGGRGLFRFKKYKPSEEAVKEARDLVEASMVKRVGAIVNRINRATTREIPKDFDVVGFLKDETQSLDDLQKLDELKPEVLQALRELRGDYQEWADFIDFELIRGTDTKIAVRRFENLAELVDAEMDFYLHRNMDKRKWEAERKSRLETRGYQRRVLSEIFRRLYGEVRDPAARQALTTETQGKIISQQMFFEELVQNGQATIWSSSRRADLGLTTKLSSNPSGNPTQQDYFRYGSLAGKYVDPEFKDFLDGKGEDVGSIRDIEDILDLAPSKLSERATSSLVRAQARMRGIALLGPGTMTRNFASAYLQFALQCGDATHTGFNSRFMENVKLLRKIWMGDPKALMKMAKYAEKGAFVLRNPSVLQDIQPILRGEGEILTKPSLLKPVDLFDRGFKKAMEFYSLLDFASKAAAYDFRYEYAKKMVPNITDEEAHQYAQDWVSKFYQNPDKVPKIVQQIGRYGLVDYVGYTWDSGRIAINAATNVVVPRETSPEGSLAAEWKGIANKYPALIEPRWRAAVGFTGARGVGVGLWGPGAYLLPTSARGVMTHVVAHALIFISKAMRGDDDEYEVTPLTDEEMRAMRDGNLVADFDRNSMMYAWHQKNKRTGEDKIVYVPMSANVANTSEDLMLGIAQRLSEGKDPVAWLQGELAPKVWFSNPPIGMFPGLIISMATGRDEKMQKKRRGMLDGFAAIGSTDYREGVKEVGQSLVRGFLDYAGPFGRPFERMLREKDRAHWRELAPGTRGAGAKPPDYMDYLTMFFRLQRSYTIDKPEFELRLPWAVSDEETLVGSGRKEWRAFTAADGNYIEGATEKEKIKSMLGRDKYMDALNRMAVKVNDMKKLYKSLGISDERVTEILIQESGLSRSEAEAVVSGKVKEMVPEELYEPEWRPDSLQKGYDVLREEINKDPENVDLQKIYNQLVEDGYKLQPYEKWKSGALTILRRKRREEFTGW